MTAKAPFQEVLLKVKRAPVVSREDRGGQTTWTFDLNDDGVADARLVEDGGAAATQEFSVLDAQGFPIETFLRRRVTPSALLAMR
jgi:hypothetical protein